MSITCINEPLEVYQGDLSDVYHVRPVYSGLADALSSDWACFQGVIDCDGNIVVDRVEVTAKVVDTNDKQRFLCALEPADTELLAVPNGYNESYTWVIEVVNDSVSPAYNREVHIPLQVKKHGL